MKNISFITSKKLIFNAVRCITLEGVMGSVKSSEGCLCKENPFKSFCHIFFA